MAALSLKLQPSPAKVVNVSYLDLSAHNSLFFSRSVTSNPSLSDAEDGYWVLWACAGHLL